MGAELSAEVTSAAKKNLTAIFRAFQRIAQTTVAERLSVSDAQISEWKNKEAEKAARILAAAGLKVVPIGLKCYEPRQMEAIVILAKAYFERMESAEQIETPEPIDWSGV